MSKEVSGNKKFQIDLFVGQQSFIYRTNDIKEIKGFTGLKKVDSETMKRYLYELNDLSSFMKPEKTIDPTAPQIDYLQKIKLRLAVMGAKNAAQALKLLKKLTGLKLKRLPVAGELTPTVEQKIYATLLQAGSSNAKR